MKKLICFIMGHKRVEREDMADAFVSIPNSDMKKATVKIVTISCQRCGDILWMQPCGMVAHPDGYMPAFDEKPTC